MGDVKISIKLQPQRLTLAKDKGEKEELTSDRKSSLSGCLSKR
jgi:hypothetical protein